MGLFDWIRRTPADNHKFLRPGRDLDAVVFVHGFNGHYINTWGKLPRLIDSDPDLPAMDILMLGYQTGFGLFQPAIDRTGRVLLSRIRFLLPNASRIVVVCHSMGGVVALSGVRADMGDGLADAHPVSALDRFVLFATPLKCQHLATAARHLCFGVPYVLRVFNAQIRQIADPDFGNEFETDVFNRIYRPAGNSKYERQIPIHVCLGKLVQEAFALFFARPIDRLPPDERAFAYLYTVVINLARSHYRRSSRTTSLDDADAWVGSTTVATSEEWRIWDIEHLLRRLPEHEQALLALLMQGYTTQEIADRLGVTYSTAAVRMHRLRQRLSSLRERDV